MKLSNFTMIKEAKSSIIGCESLGPFLAEVDVETGVLWWKKKQRKEISKSYGSLCWVFVDTGKFTPEYQAEELERAWRAQKLSNKR